MPFDKELVAHENDSVTGERDDHVSRRMPPSDGHEDDVSFRAMNRHRALDRHIGKSHFDLGKRIDQGFVFGLPQRQLESFDSGRPYEPVLNDFQFARNRLFLGIEIFLEMSFDIRAGVRRTDDDGPGNEDLIAADGIAVRIQVENQRNRPSGQEFGLALQVPGGRRTDEGIEDDGSIPQVDVPRLADGEAAQVIMDRRVNALGRLFEREMPRFRQGVPPGERKRQHEEYH
ncbi:MAG: hypothetical protein GYA74_08405 [Acidobacteria bacterium]|nr:hypothetical protein [Acidobacteriota bacterium]